MIRAEFATRLDIQVDIVCNTPALAARRRVVLQIYGFYKKIYLTLQMQSEFFKSVTIFFSDIAGFHRITMTVAPMELVRILNNLYTSMDDVIDNYDVYKVETINDSYMVASGKSHVINVHFFMNEKNIYRSSKKELHKTQWLMNKTKPNHCLGNGMIPDCRRQR